MFPGYMFPIPLEEKIEHWIKYVPILKSLPEDS